MSFIETPHNLRDTPWPVDPPSEGPAPPTTVLCAVTHRWTSQQHQQHQHQHRHQHRRRRKGNRRPVYSYDCYSGTKLDDSSASLPVAMPHAAPCIFPAGQLARAIIDNVFPMACRPFTRCHDGVFGTASHTASLSSLIPRLRAPSALTSLSVSNFCRRCCHADGPDRRHRQLGHGPSRRERQSLQPDVTIPILITD